MCDHFTVPEFYQTAGSGTKKFCKFCGKNLIRRFRRKYFNEYTGAEVIVYDYLCSEYKSMNLFTWRHTGKTWG